MSVTNTQTNRQPLHIRFGSVEWAPLSPVISLGWLDQAHLCCTRRPLLHGPALSAGSTYNRPCSPLALPPRPSRVHRWSLSRSPATSPAVLCNTLGRSIGGLCPARLLFHCPLPRPHTLLTPVVHRLLTASPVSPSPTPHSGPGQVRPRGSTKPPSQTLSQTKWINI
jgi:hypothetical protein